MKVGIIGAGPSGLTCIKSCLEVGLEPVCFEMTEDIGGLWKFSEDLNSHSSVCRSTVINTSKEMMCFSDFPIPKEFAPFMHNTKVMKYLKMYAENFGLEKYIRLQTTVKSVKRCDDFNEFGCWEIRYTTSNSESQELEIVEVFDAVLVCTGHHWSARIPHFIGIEKFPGVKIHSRFYKDFRGFEGKRIVIIGIGNSAGDIAVELSYHAKQVYLSTRRGAWVLSRIHDGGFPIDQAIVTRFFQMFPKKFIERMLESELNKRFDHENFGLKPKHSPISQHPMANDILPHRILTGNVIVKPDISHFSESTVVFTDSSEVEDIDAVILCTGYDISFPLLDEDDVSVVDNQVNLYKYMWPMHHPRHTLAIIGLFQPIGAINPIAELQARWAAQVFKELKKLPSRKEMEEDVKRKRDDMSKTYYASRRHTVQVDYIPFSDEIAEQVGCRPNLMKLFFQDPSLAIKCFFGPCTPPQFRLMGPNSWAGAKKAIEMAHSNVIYATKTRVLQEDVKPKASWVFFCKVLVIPLVIAVIFYKLQV